MSPLTKTVRRFVRALLLGCGVMLLAAGVSAQSDPGPVGTTTTQSADAQVPGRITGRVVDQTGTPVVAAFVKLTGAGQASPQEQQTDDDGLYFFTNLNPGPFELTIKEEGFATKTISGELNAGETFSVPQTQLLLATANMEVRVSESEVEVAEVEIKEQMQQRVLGIIPNFFVTYEKNPAPLNTRQKMKLAWKVSVDPLTIAGAGFVAGIQQASGSFKGYGQGAQGYAKRFGSSYADITISTYMTGAIMPTIFRQDPRYIYKGTGSARSRVFYAITSAFICRGDNRQWQPNYSNVLGSLATGAIANLYYPSTDRHGAMLTFDTALIRLGESAGANIVQEFVLRKLTPSLRHKSAAQDQRQQP